jgi:hypothetical protein
MDLTGSPDAALPGHADMVASLLSGAQGEQGMVPSASLMSVRVLDSDNSGDVFTVADGIYTAVAAGAKVLNLSLGTDQPSDVLLQAVNYAISQGAVVIAAAGNNGTGQILYPAAYPGVIAVGAIDATGERATFSDYGPELSVAAPGVGLNTVSAAGQEQFSGTSAAAPLVAGAVAALMASDSSVTAQQAVDLLSKYADFAGPLPTQSDGLVVTQTDSTGETIYSNEFYGAGVIDMERLMNRNNSNYSDAALADMYMNLDGVGLGSAQVPMQVSVQNRGNELLTDLNVTVTINSQSTTHFLSALGPGQVSAITVEVPMNELLSGSGVSLTSSVSDFAPLYPDARPDNNTLSRQVKLVPTTTSGVDTGGVTAGP